MTKEEITKKAIVYFEEHEDEFNSCIEELDNYNGYLGDDRYYPMSELGELFEGNDPDWLLCRAYFGYDADTWHTDAHGQKEFGAFCPLRDWLTFNGYGNFVSTDYKDYSDKLDKWFIESLFENWRKVYDLPAEIDKLCEEYENAEE